MNISDVDVAALIRAAVRWEKWEREVWNGEKNRNPDELLSDAEMHEGYDAEAKLKEAARRFET